MKHLPLVAIVGRPNVGKSTLFNRIVGERRALVHDMPGMTRDRLYAQARHERKPFLVVDTGGLEEDQSGLYKQMREQTMAAIEEADRVIFVTDLHQPDDRHDDEIIKRLRSLGRPFFLAVNKCEGTMGFATAYAEFSRFGLDEIFPISAMHADGVYELLDAVTDGFEELEEEEFDEESPIIRVAIVGRQNAGKSTLVNRLCGEQRVIASPIAGTTRDAIDTDVTVNGRPFTLIDTAGIRRRSKIGGGAEGLSVISSLRAIDRAEIAVLLIDVTQGITDQDQHIAGYILERRRPAVIVLNKWDLLEKDNTTYGEWIARVREEFKFMKWAPILTISAFTGQRAPKLWGLIERCSENYRREFTTAEVNLVLQKALAYVSPPGVRGKGLKIKYAVQTGRRPPTFTLFVNDPEFLHFSYGRYLENQFRMQLGLDGSPVSLRFRPKAPPRGWERHASQKKQEAEKEIRAYGPIEIGIDDEFVAADLFEDDE